MPATPLTSPCRALLLAAAVLLLTVGPIFAQERGLLGSSQGEPPPTAQCPADLICTYAEHQLLYAGYRFQALLLCGANCSAQYWVASIPDGRVLIATGAVRGGGIVAIRSAPGMADPHPPVRIVLPDYAPEDPGCCPSRFKDTTYTWDTSTASLVESSVRFLPASEMTDWDAFRASLEAEQFFDVFRRGL